jgi:hypothetical protein
LCRDHGRNAEAHQLLALVYIQLTEGFDKLDLEEVKALLDEFGRLGLDLA